MSKIIWKKSSLLIPLIGPVTIDPHNSKIAYAGTTDVPMGGHEGSGLYKSIDGGKTWKGVNDRNLKKEYWTYNIAVDPGNSEHIYVGTDKYGLFKSENGGKSWFSLNSGLKGSALNVTSFALDAESGDIYRGTADDVTLLQKHQGIFKSFDGGKTWYAINKGIAYKAVSSIAISNSNPDVIYASTAGINILWVKHKPKVYQSTDGGMTWHDRSDKLPRSGDVSIYFLTIDPDDPDIVYAAIVINTPDGTQGLYKTTNGGRTWQKKNKGLPVQEVGPVFISPHNSKTLFMGTDNHGVSISHDGGESWTIINEGLPLPCSATFISSSLNRNGNIYASVRVDYFNNPLHHFNGIYIGKIK